MSIEAPSVLQSLRKQHALKVLGSLTKGPKSRRELEAEIGLSRTTLSVIVGELLAKKTVVQNDRVEYGTGRNGRPTKLLRLNPAAGAALGIELGRSRVGIRLLSFDSSTVAERVEKVPGKFDLDADVAVAVTMLEEMIASTGLKLGGLVGAGVGIAARHADPSSYVKGVKYSQADPEGLSLKALRQILQVPLTWDNNVRLAAVAESHRSGTDEDLMYVALSAGVSCGFLANGSILRGGGNAGELGHVSVESSGPECWCGGRGCLEGYLGSAHVLARAQARGLNCRSVSELAAAVRRKEPSALAVADHCGSILGTALGNVVMLLDPQRIVLGGELAALGEPFLAATAAAVEHRQLNVRRSKRQYAISGLSTGAASMGAAQSALSTFGSIHDLV